MKAVRIRQIERLIKSLQADGYIVRPLIRGDQKRLLINVNLRNKDADEIMAQCPDLRRVEG